MGPGFFVVVVLLFAFAWFFVVRPSRRRTEAHQAMQDSVELGDEIITAGGIHGVVTEADEEQLRIEIAPEVVVTLDRRAVAAVAREVELDEADEAEAVAGPEEPGAAQEQAEPR